VLFVYFLSPANFIVLGTVIILFGFLFVFLEFQSGFDALQWSFRSLYSKLWEFNVWDMSHLQIYLESPHIQVSRRCNFLHHPRRRNIGRLLHRYFPIWCSLHNIRCMFLFLYPNFCSSCPYEMILCLSKAFSFVRKTHLQPEEEVRNDFFAFRLIFILIDPK
jgi:hypothetical protein